LKPVSTWTWIAIFVGGVAVALGTAAVIRRRRHVLGESDERAGGLVQMLIDMVLDVLLLR
jgi:hypothetical protein